MENGEIRDEQITATSQHEELSGPSNARLNFSPFGWVAKTNDLNQWLQVDFQQQAVITGISTQGRRELDQYVKSYTISFSDDGNNFPGYQAGGELKVS